jgi:hypothetical protein
MILAVIVLQTCLAVIVLQTHFQYANYFCLHIIIACACCFKFGSASKLDQDKNTTIRNLTESTSLGQCSKSMLLCHCDLCLCWDNVADVFQFFQVFATCSLTFPSLIACAYCFQTDQDKDKTIQKLKVMCKKLATGPKLKLPLC